MIDQNKNEERISQLDEEMAKLQEVVAEREKEIETMESNLRDKFNIEKKELEKKIKELQV